MEKITKSSSSGSSALIFFDFHQNFDYNDIVASVFRVYRPRKNRAMNLIHRIAYAAGWLVGGLRMKGVLPAREPTQKQVEMWDEIFNRELPEKPLDENDIFSD